VRDRTIAHAIQQAYAVATIKERSPEVHLFMEIAADKVDVNVHPAKAEVRFLEQGLVHEILRRAVVDALGDARAPELVLTASAPAAPFADAGALPLGFGRSTLTPAESAAVAAAFPRAATVPGREAVGPLVRPMTPLGQFRNTFIVAVDEEGLAIIDQHVAHERILFEQISERLTGRPLESQRLLTPVVLEVSAGEHQTLVANGPALGRFGFEFEPFGGSSLRITAVPALLDWTRCEQALRAVAADLDGLSPGSSVDEALRKVAATMACHAAVKANDPLTREKMQYLLDELRRTAHSSVCPHGRPVVLRLTRREIERNFERV
jgi:DNA mismatch repair protein MutL